jgi:1,4-dihydroxy-2-naphthoyl-CoA hydrolase
MFQFEAAVRQPQQTEAIASEGKLTPLYQPFPRLMGVEMVEATPARVRARLFVRTDLCRSGHVMHGGALMAFADLVGSIGAFLNLPEGASTTTIESKTNFIGAAKEGSTVEAESTPLHVGRRSSVWQTHIKREDGKLLAVVTQTQMVL